MGGPRIWIRGGAINWGEGTLSNECLPPMGNSHLCIGSVPSLGQKKQKRGDVTGSYAVEGEFFCLVGFKK
jgi:hypothetical protein